MRWLLAILFSLNVVLFLWIQLNPEQGQPAGDRRTAASDFGDIRLLQELSPDDPGVPADQAQQQEEPAATTEETAASTRMVSKQETVAEMKYPGSPPAERSASSRAADTEAYCGELGPFPSRNMAEGFRRKLAQASGASARIASRRGKVTVGYWVMIPPLADIQEAEEMLKRLREAGFSDLWLMRKGEYANGISMGLYTEERYARRHGDNIRSRGFDTRIEPKQKNARLFWILFSRVEPAAMEALENGKLPQDVVLQKKVCPQGSAGN
jgi:hypothetical protein